MKKNTAIVLIAIAALAIIVTVFAFLNAGMLSEKEAAQRSKEFFVTVNGQKSTVTMEFFESLPTTDIEGNHNPSDADAVTRVYRGISLKTLLDNLGLDYSGAESVTFTAADGYASAISAAEALDSERCYIVISVDGQPLGNKEDGGRGPFMMILPKDEFSQRWCKFLLDVELH